MHEPQVSTDVDAACHYETAAWCGSISGLCLGSTFLLDFVLQLWLWQSAVHQTWSMGTTDSGCTVSGWLIVTIKSRETLSCSDTGSIFSPGLYWGGTAQLLTALIIIVPSVLFCSFSWTMLQTAQTNLPYSPWARQLSDRQKGWSQMLLPRVRPHRENVPLLFDN